MCEQMAYRINIQDKVESQYKAERYEELNQQAIKRICNNINHDEQEERNLCERLAQHGEDASNPNLVPALARHAIKYHQKHDRWKKKAKEEHKREREEQYKVKGKGEWKVYKDMQKDVARPMIALKRRKPGPIGQ